MSTIRVIYEAEPTFPATDQHPDAVRYQVAGFWVDAVGGRPTEAEVLAVLNPPAPDAATSVERLVRFLAENPDVEQMVSEAKATRL